MVFVVKKKKALAQLCALVSVAGLLGAGYQMLYTKDVFLPTANKKIVIDAGHGAQYKYYR